MLGRPLGLLTPLGYHAVILVDHLLSVLLARCPAHCHFKDFILSMTSVTWVFSLIHSIRLQSLRVIPNMHLSMDLWATCSFLVMSDFRTHISLPYVRTGSIYWSKARFFCWLLVVVSLRCVSTDPGICIRLPAPMSYCQRGCLCCLSARYTWSLFCWWYCPDCWEPWNTTRVIRWNEHCLQGNWTEHQSEQNKDHV